MNISPGGRPLRMHPADLATLAILVVVTSVLIVALARGAPLLRDTVVHGGLLVGFAALTWLLARNPTAHWAPLLRGGAVIGTLFTLYSTLGHVAFAAVPWLADPALAVVDRALFLGRSVSLLAGGAPAPSTVEFLSFFYAAFIPYIYISIFLGLVARPPAERAEFITAFALLYAFSFLGYLFLPAHGPIVEMAGQFPAELQGGSFHALIVRTIDALGGPHGAFPSLHVGATFLIIGFDIAHRNVLRGLIYVPLLLLIASATLVLRYHWLIDLIAGALLALLALRLAPALLRRFSATLQAEPA